jgi:hypothetical protein
MWHLILKKLLQVCRTFGSPQSLKALYLLTFEGRQRQIFANKFSNVAEILKTACPVLNQTAYVIIIFHLTLSHVKCLFLLIASVRV